MSNANGRRILEEAKAMEHGEVACGLAISAEALSIELKRVKQQRAELLEAAKAALKEAEAWIKDQLGGTSSYQPAMDDLQLIRSAITRAAAEIGKAIP